MDDLAVTAPPATAQPTGLAFTSIGVEVEEAVFLDESEEPAAGVRESDRPSPFDLFADEADLPLTAPPLLAEPTPLARPAADSPRPAAAVVPGSAAARGALTPATRPARAKRAVEGPELFTSHTAPRPGTVRLVALFVLVATTTMFLTVQACEINRAPGSASLSQPGR